MITSWSQPDYSLITVFDHSLITAGSETMITVWSHPNHSLITVFGHSQITAPDHSLITAVDHSPNKTWLQPDHSLITAWSQPDHSLITAWSQPDHNCWSHDHKLITAWSQPCQSISYSLITTSSKPITGHSLWSQPDHIPITSWSQSLIIARITVFDHC